MNTQMKRLVALTAVAFAFAMVSSDAFALGRSKHSGYRGWTNSSSSNEGSSVTGGDNQVASNPVIPTSDSNPVPEPTSMLMLGTALAGFGGYRGLRKKFLNK